MIFVLPKHRPPIPVVTEVEKWSTVVAYTAIQASLAAITFGIAQFASVGYIFPALIAAFVPVRKYLVSRLFDENDLKHLDPTGETSEDYDEEQIIIEQALLEAKEIDEADVFHGFSEFRAADVPHDPKEYYKKHPEHFHDDDHTPSDPTTATGLRKRAGANVKSQEKVNDHPPDLLA